jgi:predicted nucleic acid-binding Zn ribbon protein
MGSTTMGPQETRREAYETSKVDPADNRTRVIQYLRESRGATCDEIERWDKHKYGKEGMQFSSAGAIILDLRREGWVVQSTTEPTRKTQRGHNATVWVMLDTQLPLDQRKGARESKLKTAAKAVIAALDLKDAKLLRICIEGLRDVLNEEANGEING